MEVILKYYDDLKADYRVLLLDCGCHIVKYAVSMDILYESYEPEYVIHMIIDKMLVELQEYHPEEKLAYNGKPKGYNYYIEAAKQTHNGNPDEEKPTTITTKKPSSNIYISTGGGWSTLGYIGNGGIYGSLDGAKFSSIAKNTTKITADWTLSDTENPVADLYAQRELSYKSWGLPGAQWVTQCPSGGLLCSGPTLLYYIVQHLNDAHKWTREAIADWLESIHDPTGENGPNLNFSVRDDALDNGD